MARTSLTTAVTAGLVALIATLTLLRYFGSVDSTFALPRFGQSTTSSDDGQTSQRFLLGVGKADITGPVVEINFMGYADPAQKGTGLRQRLYSRAFIIGSPDEPKDRFVYVVQDIQSGDTAVRQGILDGLRELGGEYVLYGQQNVAVIGTHSHSGPGAWLNYLLPQITSMGFNRPSYDAVVQGSIRSIQRAHEKLRPGYLSLGRIKLEDGNINRSPYAYEANPEEEREKYEDTVDKELTLLKFQAESDGKDMGVLTWYPVHGTSMLGNNTLVTGDNKGVAADLFERYARKSDNASPDFVAGFSQANVGDTSPNVLGAFCESGPQVGQSCDFKTSLCAGKAKPCHARGAHWGLNDAGTASAYESGRRQYVAARQLFQSMRKDPAAYVSRFKTVSPTVKALHVYVDFANRTFELDNGTSVRTCAAALGYSFAAGTTDGPGGFDFKQHNKGDPDANIFWEFVRNRIHKPDADQIACQGIKPILLDVGQTKRPYLWTPNYVDLQFFRVGSFFIIVSPGEATTMAGRRWRAAVESTALETMSDASASGSSGQATVVLGGPANSYTHYIATEEEYHIQRYEGASTLYGPHTLAGYVDLTRRFLPYLDSASVTQSNTSLPPLHPSLPALDPGPSPPINTDVSLNFITPVVRDSPGFFKNFGDVTNDVERTYTLSTEKIPVIEAEFIGANPRNDMKLERSYAYVERFDPHTGIWSVFRDDSDWGLVFEWTRSSTVAGTSRARVRWEIGWDVGMWGREDSPQTVRKVSFSTGPSRDRQGDKTELKSWRGRHVVGGRSMGAGPMRILHGKVVGFGDDYVGLDELKGRYRLRYTGDAKSLGGGIESFQGTSSEFDIL